MTVGTTSMLLPISESSQIAEARRVAAEVSRTLGFSDELEGRVSIIASEAAANLVKHAREGRLQIRACGDQCIELLAFDRGPGMRDPSACLRDGFSSAGTSGTGLGAIRRLATDFDIYSQPGKGTAVVARVALGESKRTSPHIQVGVVQSPMRGESVCGDAWTVVREPEGLTVMVADGLGHGPFAAEAAQAAVRIVESFPGLEPGERLERIHSALRSTRGAAVAVARVHFQAALVRYAGLGNIAGILFGAPAVQRLVSHNGTAGAQARRIQQFEYRWPANALLVMYSDGIASHWDLNAYPGLSAHDPAIISAVLFRDHNRGRDDATVVIVKAAA